MAVKATYVDGNGVPYTSSGATEEAALERAKARANASGNNGTVPVMDVGTLKGGQAKADIQTPNTPTGLYSMAGYLDTYANSNKDAFTQKLDAAAEAAKTSADTSFEDFLKEKLGIKGKAELTSDQYALNGVDTAQQEYNDVNNEILSEQTALRHAVERLKTTNPLGKGAIGIQNEIDDLTRKSLSKQADLAVIALAKQGKLDTAKATADRAVDAIYEKETNRLDALQLNYERNKDLFTTAEQRQFETAQDDRKRELDMQKSKELARFEQSIRQNDPLYKAQLIKAYRDAGLDANGNPISESTTPLIDPTTGKADPVGNFASFVKAVGAKDNATLQAIGGVLSSVQDLAHANESGSFPGLGFITAPIDALSTPEARANKAYIEAINLKVQQWASGAALTKEQTAQVAKITPRQGDTYGQTKSKLNALANFMLSQARGTLASQGFDYAPGRVDFFSSTLSQDDLKDVQDIYGSGTGGGDFNAGSYFTP